MGRLVGFGLVNVDLVAVVPHWQPDTKVDASQWIEQIGGPVPVALCAASRLGTTPAPVFIGTVGADDWGRRLQTELNRHSVAGCLLRRRSVPTPRSLVMLDARDGNRTIAHWSAPSRPRQFNERECEFLGNAEIVHLDGRDLVGSLKAARLAKTAGGTVSWDLGTMRPGREELFPLIDIVIASKGGGAGAFPDCAGDPIGQVRGFLERGARIAAVTLAENGVVVGERGSDPLHLPAIPTDPIRDTCGAGDTFHGAFLHATLHGADAVEAARYAQAAASLRIGRIGHRDGLPTNAEVNRLLSAPNA